MKNSGENVCENMLRGTPAPDLFGGEVFALGSGQEVDFVQGHALLFGKADRSACRRADHIVRHSLGRTGDFTDDIGLADRKAACP